MSARRRRKSGDRRRRQAAAARLINQAREVVYRTPEVRPEKVAAIKEAIEQGTYEIDAEKLAEIILAELNLKR